MRLLVQFEPPTFRIDFDMKFLIDFGKLFLKVLINCLERPFLMGWERQNDSAQLFSRCSGFFMKIYREADISDQLEMVAHVFWSLPDGQTDRHPDPVWEHFGAATVAIPEKELSF